LSIPRRSHQCSKVTGSLKSRALGGNDNGDKEMFKASQKRLRSRPEPFPPALLPGRLQTPPGEVLRRAAPSRLNPLGSGSSVTLQSWPSARVCPRGRRDRLTAVKRRGQSFTQRSGGGSTVGAPLLTSPIIWPALWSSSRATVRAFLGWDREPAVASRAQFPDAPTSPVSTGALSPTASRNPSCAITLF